MEIDDGVWIRFKADTSQLLGEISKISPMLRDMGENLKEAGTKLSAAITVPMTAIAGLGLTAFAGFEQSMNRVQAMTGAARENLKGLSDQALELGSATQFSSSKIATAMGDLASAGLTVEQIYQGIPGVLDFAAAGQIHLADAAKTATNIMHEFGMQASDMGKIADTLAFAASKSSGEVKDFGVAFQYFGPIAKVANISLAETAAAFELLANAGVRGSKAGTAMRQMISALENPSKQAADAMERLGIEVTNADGKLLPLSELIRNLRPLLEDTGAGFQIFGRRFSDVLSIIQAGPTKFEELASAAEHAEGAAGKMASTLMQGFSGEWKRFIDELDTMRVKIGAALAPVAEQVLRNFGEPIIRVIGTLADLFAKLPMPIQQFSLAITGLVAVAGPTLYVLGTLTEAAARLGTAWPLILKGAGEIPAVMSGLRGAFTGAAEAVAVFVGSLNASSLGSGLVNSFRQLQTAGELMIVGLKDTFASLPALVMAQMAFLRLRVVEGLGETKLAISGWATGLPAMIESAFASMMSVITTAFSSVVAFIQNISWTGLVAGLSSAGEAVVGFGVVLAGVAVPAAAAIAAIAGIGAVGYVIYKDWAYVKPVLAAIWSDLQKAATVTFAATATFINDIFGTKLTTSIAAAWKQFLGVLRDELAQDAQHLQLLAQALHMTDTANALGKLQAQWQGMGAAMDRVASQAQNMMRAQADAAGGLVRSTSAATTSIKQQGDAATTLTNAITRATAASAAAAQEAQAHAAALLAAQQRGEALKRTLDNIDVSRLRAETEAWRASLDGLDVQFHALDESIRASGEHTADFSHALDGITEVSVPGFKELDSTVEQLGTVTIPKTTQSVSGLSRMWDDAIRGLERGISDIIINGKSASDVFLKLGRDILAAFIDQTVHAGIKALIGGLFDVEGSVGKLSKAFSGLGDTMSKVLGGGGGAAGSAAGSIAGGITGIVGAIGSIGGMISGIIGNFQNARMETTLNAIEESTRYMKSYLRDNIIPDEQRYWPRLDNLAQLLRLEGIENAIVKLSESGLGQSNFMVEMIQALQQLPPEVGQGIGQGMTAIAQAMTSQATQAFQPMINALDDIRNGIDAFRQQAIAFLQPMAQAMIATYSVLAKPGWVGTSQQQITGGPSGGPNSGSNTFNVIVNSNGNNPYTYGQNVIQGINSQLAVRI